MSLLFLQFSRTFPKQMRVLCPKRPSNKREFSVGDLQSAQCLILLKVSFVKCIS